MPSKKQKKEFFLIRIFKFIAGLLGFKSSKKPEGLDVEMVTTSNSEVLLNVATFTAGITQTLDVISNKQDLISYVKDNKADLAPYLAANDTKDSLGLPNEATPDESGDFFFYFPSALTPAEVRVDSDLPLTLEAGEYNYDTMSNKKDGEQGKKCTLWSYYQAPTPQSKVQSGKKTTTLEHIKRLITQCRTLSQEIKQQEGDWVNDSPN
jgi:hypothetical protein